MSIIEETTEDTIEIPMCGVCNTPKIALFERTENLDYIVWVCTHRKAGQRLPCDGLIPALRS